MALENKVNGNYTSDGLIVSFGEMLIDFVPTMSGVSLAGAPGFLKAPGGAPANVAISVARLGGRSAFVGKLGDDEFGHMLAGILKENGVTSEGILFDKGARTALAFVTLRSDGEREFMFYRNPSADMLLTDSELNLELIRKVCALLEPVLMTLLKVFSNNVNRSNVPTIKFPPIINHLAISRGSGNTFQHSLIRVKLGQRTFILGLSLRTTRSIRRVKK